MNFLACPKSHAWVDCNCPPETVEKFLTRRIAVAAAAALMVGFLIGVLL
jgi:hypothetical protein